MTYEETIARKRQKLEERVSLFLPMQQMGDISAAQMAQVLDETARELRVLEDLEQPIERDSA